MTSWAYALARLLLGFLFQTESKYTRSMLLDTDAWKTSKRVGFGC